MANFTEKEIKDMYNHGTPIYGIAEEIYGRDKKGRAMYNEAQLEEIRDIINEAIKNEEFSSEAVEIVDDTADKLAEAEAKIAELEAKLAKNKKAENADKAKNKQTKDTDKAKEK